jgi:ATP-dependent DNA ligase
VHSGARHRSPFRSGLHSRSENGDRVRLFSRNGNEWTKRYPWIVEAARKIRQQQRFVLDGEAVVLGVDGIADFNALHSRQHDEEVQFCALSQEATATPSQNQSRASAGAPAGRPSIG